MPEQMTRTPHASSAWKSSILDDMVSNGCPRKQSLPYPLSGLIKKMGRNAVVEIYFKRPLNALCHNPLGHSRFRAQPYPKETQLYVRFAICKSTFIFSPLAMSCCTIISTS
jgi:hypothetical protein